MKVNEIFYSIQGEGHWTGHPATFVRLSGCNLHCPFCDTDHEQHTEMSEYDIADAVIPNPSPIVIITGGEPGLQLTHSLVQLLKTAGKRVHVETNGTCLNGAAEAALDWITLSPKTHAMPRLNRCHELKVVWQQQDMEQYRPLIERYRPLLYLQPCDTGSPEDNLRLSASAIAYVKEHPQWTLSPQIHKLLNIR